MTAVLHGGPPARRRVSLAAVVCGITMLAGCTGDTGPIKIGVTGNFQDVNIEPMREGARLAVEEINARGGVNGRPLELVERDDWENPDSAVAVATDLYNSGVVAVIGHGFSGLTLAAAPVYNGGPNPVLQISPTASAPAVSDAGPYTFRMCPSDQAHGGALARWARDGLGFRRGAVLYGNDDYGRGVRRAFTEEFGALGGDVVEVDPYLGSPPEVGPYIERLASRRRAQFLVVAGYLDEAEHILRSARAKGVTIPIMGGDGLERIERMGAIAEGTYVTAAYLSLIDTPKNRQFVARWSQRYPGKAAPNLAAAATYDAVYMISGVVGEVGTERAAVRDEVAQIGNSRPAFEGVIGTVAFDQNGDVTIPNIFVSRVHDGEVELAGGGQ